MEKEISTDFQISAFIDKRMVGKKKKKKNLKRKEPLSFRYFDLEVLMRYLKEAVQFDM